MAIYSLTKWKCTPKGRHGWGLQTGRFTVAAIAAMATHCSKSHSCIGKKVSRKLERGWLVLAILLGVLDTPPKYKRNIALHRWFCLRSGGVFEPCLTCSMGFSCTELGPANLPRLLRRVATVHDELSVPKGLPNPSIPAVGGSKSIAFCQFEKKYFSVIFFKSNCDMYCSWFA